MSYNGKNYAEQGGDKWVIGGTLEIKEGATVTRPARRGGIQPAGGLGFCTWR